MQENAKSKIRAERKWVPFDAVKINAGCPKHPRGIAVETLR